MYYIVVYLIKDSVKWQFSPIWLQKEWITGKKAEKMKKKALFPKKRSSGYLPQFNP